MWWLDFLDFHFFNFAFAYIIPWFDSYSEDMMDLDSLIATLQIKTDNKLVLKV